MCCSYRVKRIYGMRTTYGYILPSETIQKYIEKKMHGAYLFRVPASFFVFIRFWALFFLGSFYFFATENNRFSISYSSRRHFRHMNRCRDMRPNVRISNCLSSKSEKMLREDAEDAATCRANGEERLEHGVLWNGEQSATRSF